MSDKRQQIIVAAREVFRTKGLERAKIADITKAAGIALGTFYLYYPSKFSVIPDIAMQFLQHMTAEVQKDFDVDAPFEAKLRHIVDATFRCLEEERDVYALLLAGLIPTGYSKQWEQIYQPFYEWLGDFLKEYQAAGVVRPGLNPERTAKLILGAVENAAERIFLFDEPTAENIRLEKRELMLFIKNAVMV